MRCLRDSYSRIGWFFAEAVESASMQASCAFHVGSSNPLACPLLGKRRYTTLASQPNGGANVSSPEIESRRFRYIRPRHSNAPRARIESHELECIGYTGRVCLAHESTDSSAQTGLRIRSPLLRSLDPAALMRAPPQSGRPLWGDNGLLTP